MRTAWFHGPRWDGMGPGKRALPVKPVGPFAERGSFMNAQIELPFFTAVEEDRPAPSPVTALPRQPPRHSGLVGRESELRELRGFLREAMAHGAARVLRGHAGSGKSELLEAGVGMAASASMRVLRCTGIRGGTAPDLSGLLQIVRPALRGLRRSSADGRLPCLETMLADGVPTQDDRSRLPYAVLGVLESISAGQPLLIAVDDWDALDEPSREVLSFVARRTTGHPMGVLITSRPHRAREASLAALPELPLGPLTRAQSAALLAARRPGNDAQTVRELLATAAGNPLALLELPVRSEDRLPYAPASSERLASAMAPGAARLPQGTRDLLLVAALHPAGELPCCCRRHPVSGAANWTSRRWNPRSVRASWCSTAHGWSSAIRRLPEPWSTTSARSAAAPPTRPWRLYWRGTPCRGCGTSPRRWKDPIRTWPAASKPYTAARWNSVSRHWPSVCCGGPPSCTEGPRTEDAARFGPPCSPTNSDWSAWRGQWRTARFATR